MALSTFTTTTSATVTTTGILTLLLTLLLVPSSYASDLIPLHHHHQKASGLPKSDVDLVEFPLNLEYLEAEFFLWGALGRGLDTVAPNLTSGGPPPIGARQAKLDPLIRDIITQFALQEVGHLRFIFIILLLFFACYLNHTYEHMLVYIY